MHVCIIWLLLCNHGVWVVARETICFAKIKLFTMWSFSSIKSTLYSLRKSKSKPRQAFRKAEIFWPECITWCLSGLPHNAWEEACSYTTLSLQLFLFFMPRPVKNPVLPCSLSITISLSDSSWNAYSNRDPFLNCKLKELRHSCYNLLWDTIFSFLLFSQVMIIKTESNWYGIHMNQ